MLDLYEELKSLIKRLDEDQIHYALCGGLALAIYGIPRATVDIDVLIRRESLGQIQAITRGMGYIMKAETMTFARGAIEIHRVSKKEEESRNWLSLDFLLVNPQVEKVWDSRLEVEWEGGELWVVSREGLIYLKSIRGSGQDLDDIQKLKEGTDEG